MLADFPKITVLMPVYNGQDYLKESINSILSQTYSNFEFLIINDGCTDRSVEIIKSYNDKRIQLVHNPTNLRLIETLNRGIELTTTGYLARMDSDDVSLPNRLQVQINYLLKNTQNDIVGSWIEVFKESDHRIWKYGKTHNEISAQLLFNSSMPHPATLFGPRVLNDKTHFKYEKNFPHAEDYRLWTKLYKKYSFSNIQNVLYRYRQHENSVTKKYCSTKKHSADNIRFDLLKDMGITVNDTDTQVHSTISNLSFPNEETSLEKACNWLNKLHKVNKNGRHFPEPFFSNILSERLYQICRMHQEQGVIALKAFWESPLSDYTNLRFKNKLGFVAKSLFKIKAL